MSLKLIMNESGQLGHGGTSTIFGGAFTVISIASTKWIADGKGVYSGDLEYSFTGGSAPLFVAGTIATTSTQKIKPSAIKVLADGNLVIRIEDFGAMNATGTLSAGGSSTISGPVEVAAAGQSAETAL